MVNVPSLFTSFPWLDLPGARGGGSLGTGSQRGLDCCITLVFTASAWVCPHGAKPFQLTRTLVG